MENMCQKGRIGESIAISYLTCNGYNVINKNFRKRCGEVDIIAEHEGVLVFIEVKTRFKRTGCMTIERPESSINSGKIKRIRRTALYYIKEVGLHPDSEIRFDVISLEINKNRGKLSHIRSAF